MKDIEKIVKDALQNHEFPYDPHAWNALESKLPKPKTRINFTKWTMVGFAAAALAVSAFIIFSPKDSSSTPVAQKQAAENKKTTSPQTTNSTNYKKSTSIAANTSQLKSGNEDKKVIFTPPIINEDENLLQQIDEKSPNIVYPNLITDAVTDVASNPEHTQKPNPFESNDLKIPIIDASCQGDVFEWLNSNGSSVFLKSPSGKTTEIKSKEKFKSPFTEIGTYTLGKYTKNGFEEKHSFKIKANPSINLAIENELNYENGLPILKSSIETYESRISWRSNNIGFDNGGKTSNLSIYNKGRYEISVSVINDFGCETTETKTFISHEEYNLLAVNAFNPNSNDNRNNTFMPFALKQRNTPFKLIIIDPNDGGILFESSDASSAWEGIDKRDGKMVNPNKVYIWKVTLSSPEKGEKSEYKGTITRVL